MGKEVSKAKFADHTQVRVYFGTINGFYRILLAKANCVQHSKHAVFDETIFPVRTFKTSIVFDNVIEVHHEHCAPDNISRILLLEVDQAMRESKDHSDRMVRTSKETDVEDVCEECESGDECDFEMESEAVESPPIQVKSENHLSDLLSISDHSLEAITNLVHEKL